MMSSSSSSINNLQYQESRNQFDGVLPNSEGLYDIGGIAYKGMTMKSCECEVCSSFMKKMSQIGEKKAWLNAHGDTEYGVLDGGIADGASYMDYPLYINDILSDPDALRKLDICASHFREVSYGKVRKFQLEQNPTSGLVDLLVEGVINASGLDLMMNRQMQSFSIAYYVLKSVETGEHVGNILDELSICVDPKIPGCIATVKNSSDDTLDFNQRSLTQNEVSKVMDKMKHMNSGCARLKNVSDIIPVKKLVYSMPINHEYSKSILKLKIGGSVNDSGMKKGKSSNSSCKSGSGVMKDSYKKVIGLKIRSSRDKGITDTVTDGDCKKDEKNTNEKEDIDNAKNSGNPYVRQLTDIMKKNQIHSHQLNVTEVNSHRECFGKSRGVTIDTQEHSKNHCSKNGHVDKNTESDSPQSGLYKNMDSNSLVKNGGIRYKYRIFHKKNTNTSLTPNINQSTFVMDGTTTTAIPPQETANQSTSTNGTDGDPNATNNAPISSADVNGNKSGSNDQSINVNNDPMETEDKDYKKQINLAVKNMTREELETYSAKLWEEAREIEEKKITEKKLASKRRYEELNGIISKSFLDENDKDSEDYKVTKNTLDTFSEKIISLDEDVASNAIDIIKSYDEKVQELTKELNAAREKYEKTSVQAPVNKKRRPEEATMESTGKMESTSNQSWRNMVTDPFTMSIIKKNVTGGSSGSNYKNSAYSSKQIGWNQARPVVPVKNSYDNSVTEQQQRDEFHKESGQRIQNLNFIEECLKKGSELYRQSTDPSGHFYSIRK